MKIRLEGTKDEIKWAVDSLKKVYSVTDQSKLYQNRDKTTCRCYLEVTPFFVRSESSEPQPKPWDAVLGEEKNNE